MADRTHLPKNVGVATQKVHEAVVGLDLTDVLAIGTAMISMSIVKLADGDVAVALKLVDAARNEIRHAVEGKLVKR